MWSDIRWSNRRFWTRIIILSLACLAVLIPTIYGFERFLLSLGRNRSEISTVPPEPFFQREAPGLIQPPTSSAQGSGMRDEDEVIGVEIGGRARAYRIAALGDRANHVVNDMIGGVPVTVTYCNITKCVRVYTDPQGTAPLGLSVGGLAIDKGQQMVLKFEGHFYFQKSGKPIELGSGQAAIPYDLIEPTRTTWKEWVGRHPDTEVYTGIKPGKQAEVVEQK